MRTDDELDQELYGLYDPDGLRIDAMKYSKRALLLLEEWRGTEAAHLAEIVCLMDPGVAIHHIIAGKACALKGDDVRSREHLAEAVRLNPADNEARLRLGVALARSGDHPRAIENFRVCSENGYEPPRVYGYLCDALIETKNWLGAVAAYENRLRANPRVDWPAQQSLFEAIRYRVIFLKYFIVTAKQCHKMGAGKWR